MKRIYIVITIYNILDPLLVWYLITYITDIITIMIMMINRTIPIDNINIDK